MTQIRHFTYPSSDHRTQIHAVEWKPEGEVRAILQISHGMLEYIERYDEFGRWMSEQGILVVGNDHLGHGSSVHSEADMGFFADKNGNKALIADIRQLQRLMQEQYPDLPYFLLGHSMGSFLARQYLCMYGSRLDGAVISGTGWHSGAEAKAGMYLCSALSKTRGWRYRSRMVDKLAVGAYNKQFEPARTPSDWLTRDEAVVDEFRSDPRTQHTFTINAYFNLFLNLNYLSTFRNLKKMPKELPVFFISGGQDPVGSFGMGVKKTVLSFQSAGMKHVDCKIYPNDRHEVLNELNRLEVFRDILDWMEPLLLKGDIYGKNL